MKRLLQKVFLNYLHTLARLQLSKNPSAKAIGVTGSSGKGSTREAIFAGIRDSINVKHCSKGNSETGIPMDILGLEIHDYSMRDWMRIAVMGMWKLLVNWERYDVLLVEMGVDSNRPPKNMCTLLGIVQPEIGVFLNVSSVHAENYVVDGTMSESSAEDMIAEEKGRMIEGLPEFGYAILNSDDTRVAAFAKRTKAKVITFGDTGCIRIVRAGSSVQKGFTVEYQIEDKRCRLAIKDEVLGPQFGYTFGSAIGIGMALGLEVTRVIEGIQNYYEVIPGRGRLLHGMKGAYIIDGSYNASKLAVMDTMRLIKDIKAPKKIAVLGDLREIGELKKDIHVAIAKEAKKVFDEVILVGEFFSTYVKPAKRLYTFKRADQAVNTVEKLMSRDSVVLVKGGQNMIYLEYLVERILAEPEDVDKLCRRGAFWDGVRKEWFSKEV